MKNFTKRISGLLMLLSLTMTVTAQNVKDYPVWGSGFKAGSNMTAKGNEKGQTVRFHISERGTLPFVQSAVRQNAGVVTLGPDKDVPYFTVRYALPIPPSYTPTETAALTGLDFGVYHHNHSPRQWRCPGRLLQYTAGKSRGRYLHHMGAGKTPLRGRGMGHARALFHHTGSQRSVRPALE